MRKISPGACPARSWPVDYFGAMLVAPGGYTWVLSRRDTYPGLGSAYAVVDANAQDTIKGLEQDSAPV